MTLLDIKSMQFGNPKSLELNVRILTIVLQQLEKLLCKCPTQTWS